MIKDRIPAYLVTQLTQEKKDEITRIKREKIFDKQSLIKLWHCKKNLLQLNDESEYKIYKGSFSLEEAIMYCRKMIRKIKIM